MSTQETPSAPRVLRQYLTAGEFAHYAQRSRQAIHRAAALGQLPGAKRRPGVGQQPWMIPAVCLAMYGVDAETIARIQASEEPIE